MLYVDSVSVESKIVIPKFLDPPSLNDAPPLFPFYKQMQKRRDNPFFPHNTPYFDTLFRHKIKSEITIFLS